MKIENDLVEVIVDKKNTVSSVPELPTSDIASSRDREINYRCEQVHHFKSGWFFQYSNVNEIFFHFNL